MVYPLTEYHFCRVKAKHIGESLFHLFLHIFFYLLRPNKTRILFSVIFLWLEWLNRTRTLSWRHGHLLTPKRENIILYLLLYLRRVIPAVFNTRDYVDTSFSTRRVLTDRFFKLVLNYALIGKGVSVKDGGTFGLTLLVQKMRKIHDTRFWRLFSF